MRAALYVRVSSVRQVEQGHSLEEQEDRGRGFIRRMNGWTLEERHVFVESGVSSTKDGDRPALTDLIEAIDADEVDVVVGGDIDRIGRSFVHTYELLQDWTSRGLQVWHADGRDYSGTDPSSKAMIRNILNMAEYERDMIGERSRRAVPGKRARGSFNGGPVPWGYVKGPDSGSFIEDPVAAGWVRQIFRWYTVDKWSFYRIAQELTAKEVPKPRGGEWRIRDVKDIICRTAYKGELPGGQKAKWEPLVSYEVWSSADARRQAESNLQGNGRGRRPNVHLLGRGLLQCQCGTSMVPRKATKLKGETEGKGIYRCGDRISHPSVGNCQIPNLPREVVDGAVMKFLWGLVSPAIDAGKAADRLHEAASEARAALNSATQAKAQAEARLRTAQDKWFDGRIEDAEWTESVRPRFEREIATAGADIEQAQRTLDVLDNPDEATLEAVDRLRSDIENAVSDPSALTQYRALIEKLYARFEVIQAPPDSSPEHGQISFVYYEPSGSTRKAEDRTWRYFLHPVPHADIAALYGAVPPPIPSDGSGPPIDPSDLEDVTDAQRRDEDDYGPTVLVRPVDNIERNGSALRSIAMLALLAR